MRAVVLDEPGPIENLVIRELPIPAVPPDGVRIRVKAFGLNRSELHTRLGLGEGVTFPRVLGIEATGVIDGPGDSGLAVGQKVATMMGGMGRVFDGGYAEYVSVPTRQVIPFESELPWSLLGALPETLQTAYGSLTVGLDLRPGQVLLVRGGTSSTGLAAIGVAREIGAIVLATTRSPSRAAALDDMGAIPVVDDGNVAAQVRARYPHGVDAALELIGTPTLPDTLRATKVHGTVCFTGMLSNEWIVREFYPIAYIPNGVRLTAYGGESSNLPAAVLQGHVDRIASGHIRPGPVQTYTLDQIRDAHDDMEKNRAVGKQVIVL
ncbi:MAG: zinc-binding dehydrogenase [Deltaproteobacteria bacterium]|nr:zinc-binding dehydrogenase [Nannocystaceae bacterium]